ncbi:hypothetical protein ACFX15_005638 [Malus domestica]
MHSSSASDSLYASRVSDSLETVASSAPECVSCPINHIPPSHIYCDPAIHPTSSTTHHPFPVDPDFQQE